MTDNPCGNATRHTSRIGCCASCKQLFSSDAAFQRHRKNSACLDPAERGLIGRDSKTAPGETIWGFPTNERWTR